MVYFIKVCCQQTCMTHTTAVCTVKNSWWWTEKLSETCRVLFQKHPSWSCPQAVSKPVCHIPLLCVQWKTPDDGQSNCPKHVEFYSKNKFEKLVHLVGFIIRMFIYEVKIQSCHLKCCWKCITCRLFTGFLHSLIILYSVSNWQNHSKGVISLYCVLLFKLKFALHSQYWTYSRVYLPFVGKIFPPLFYPSKPPRPPQRRLHHVRPPTAV